MGACILEAPEAHGDRVRALARRAAVMLPRLEAHLGVEPSAPYRILLIPEGVVGDAEMMELDASAPGWAAGFLLPERRLGAVRLALAHRYPHDDTASVLIHEAAHMLLHDAAGGRLPRWFGEGVATWEGRRWGLRDVVVYSSALLTGSLPSLSDLDPAFRRSPAQARAAYAASFDFISWTVRRHGDGVLRRLLREAARKPFPEAWEAATGTSLAAAEARWRWGSLLWYRWIPALTGTTTLWIGITLLALLAVARRRSRSREILDRWEADGD